MHIGPSFPTISLPWRYHVIHDQFTFTWHWGLIKCHLPISTLVSDLIPFHYHERVPPTALSKPKLAKADAEKAVIDISAQMQSQCQLVAFKEYQKSHQSSLFKSKQYENFFVLCYENTMHHAGRMVFPYVRNVFCPVTKGLFEIDTKKGGTNRFKRHMSEHDKASGKANRLAQNFPSKCSE